MTQDAQDKAKEIAHNVESKIWKTKSKVIVFFFLIDSVNEGAASTKESLDDGKQVAENKIETSKETISGWFKRVVSRKNVFF